LAQIGLTERPQHKCDEHAQIWDEHDQKSVIFSMWRFGLARWVARSGVSQKPFFWGLPTGHGGEIDLGEMSENGPILTRPSGPRLRWKKTENRAKKELNERSEKGQDVMVELAFML
jgi:hypothetical protein